ncbi:MAG: amino acid adenylation domain-containing protein, partial [Deltaproteobacteria bacterium]|nr:amino acid adenylation domain-containing protein [Deltaproteobacteria bacterium]
MMRKIPASRFQEKFFLEERILSGRPYNNISIAYEIRGDLHGGLLEAAWGHVMGAHDSLRASFREEQGRLFMRLHDDCRPVFEEITLADREAAERLMEDFVKRPFDLGSPPPHRVLLIHLGPAHHLFLFVFHHIITDGTTLEPLLPQWAAAYNALAAGQELPLIAADCYADYLPAEQAFLAEYDQATQLRFWEELVGGRPLKVPVPVFPGAEPGFQARYFELDLALADAAKSLARRGKSTFFWAFAGAWAALLFRYSGQAEIAVGYPVNLRPAKFPRLLGPFINNLPLLARFGPETSFRELLAAITGQRRDVKGHQHCMLADILAHLRDIKKQPADARLNAAVAETALRTAYPLPLQGLEVRALEPVNVGMSSDLLLEYEEQEGKIRCRLAYDGNRFPAWFAAQLGDQFQTLLKALTAAPELPIAAIPLLEGPQRERLLHSFNATRRDFPRQLLHRIFEEQAARRSHEIAVQDPLQELTWGELNARANRIAHALLAKGLLPDTPVGLHLERGVGLMAAILGIHKAGGAYLPLDPSYPLERRAFMMADAGLEFLIAGPGTIPDFKGALLRSDDPEIDTFPADDPEVDSHPDHAAYVIYTSGSTGTPKGVVVEHRNLVNQILWFENRFPLAAGDVILQKTPSSFDASIWELFWWLAAGTPLVFLEPGGEKDPRRIIETIEQHRVTVAQFVPSLLHAVAECAEEMTPGKLSSLRHVFCGGEVLTRQAVERLARLTAPGTGFHNLYGPTETTIDASCYTCPAILPDIIPIGSPVDNTQLYVLDERQAPQPLGVAGELHVGGAQVARGYLNRPELTAERFIPNPFGPGRLYKTGDLARWLPDGNLEFLGRCDQQVKVRGHRIEPGEIESLLRRHPGVREAIVHPVGEGLERRLCAWIVGDCDPCRLRAHLAAWLPAAMIPDLFSPLSALPLTPSGKVDRQALPAPESTPTSRYAPPENPRQEALCAIFAELLKVDRVGIHDDFFALGGHSLLATRLVNAVNRTFRTELPLRTVFDGPTPAALATELEGSGAIAPPIARSGRTEGPLSFAQARLWFLDRFEEGSAAYNIPSAIRIRGALQVPILEQALAVLIRRHLSLRTIFREDAGGGVSQRVAPFESFSLPAEPVPEQELRELLAAEARHRFDLRRGPLFRFRLLCLAPDDFVLAANIHHIVFDGWSFGILFRELAACYRAGLEGKDPELPEIQAEYLDFAIWQRERLNAAHLERQSAYWKERLRGIPELLQLPADRPRPDIQSTRGGLTPLALDTATAQALRGLAQERNATLFMVLESLWAVFLGKYSGSDDLVIGVPLAGRTRPEIEQTAGFFVNTLPLRHDLNGNPFFTEVLAATRQATLEADTHQEIPFEKLVDELAPRRSTSHAPLFQTLFVLGDASFDNVALPGLETAPLFPEFDCAKYDLTLSLGELNGRLEGHLEFSSDLFDRATAERMGRHFIQLCRSLAADPEARLSQLSLLSPAERDRVVEGFNTTAAAFPADQTLHRLFEEQVRRDPGRIALACGAKTLGYRELNARANRIAHALIAAGIGPEDRVGLCLERGPDLVAALLGILKAGAAYVPLDPRYPEPRLAFLEADAKLQSIVTVKDLSDRFKGDFLLIDGPGLEAFPDTDPEVGVGPGNLACVIYTSGSTGAPKGVAVEHLPLVSKIATLPQLLAETLDSPALVCSSVSFDPFIEQLMLGLAYGQTAILLDEELSDPGRFWETVEAHGVRRADLVPSIAAQL